VAFDPASEDHVTETREPGTPATEASTSVTSPSAAPEAVLRTFLIADIRGYTTYTRERGDEAGAALAARFAELVAEVVTARDGFLLELRGDEALVVFVSARKALRAAIDLQARFIEAELPRGVGIGLDAGEAIPVGDGYRGTALNLASRLCSHAVAGETLASEAVIHLAAKVDGIAYVDPRSLKLKGYTDSVRAVAVVPSDRARGRRLASGNGSRGLDGRVYAVAGVALVVVALLAGVLGGGFLGRGGSPTPGAANASGSSAPPGGAALPSGAPSGSPGPLAGIVLPVLAFYDAKTGTLEGTTPLSSPSNIAFFSNGSFWALGENRRALNRIDPVSHKIVQWIPVPLVEANGFSFDDDAIWVTDLAGPHVVRIDKRTGAVADYPFGKDASDRAAATDVVVGGGSVWLARPDIPELVRLDPETGKVQSRIPVNAWGLAFGGGALWYWEEGRIGRIDPVTNEQTFDPIVLSPDTWLGNISFGGGDAWTTEPSSGHVWRVDRSGRPTSYALQPGTGELSATDKTMWVTNANNGELTGIDLVTGLTDRVIDTGHATLAVAAGGDEIMIAVGPTVDEAIADLRGSVLTIATSGSPWTDPSPDPALNGDWQVRQALYLTCVALLNYPDKPAPDGWTLEPEVAAAMPTVSADGRTYTFTIKPGFMFSPPSNEPVTADTFRATMERALSPVFDDGAPGPQHLSDIVGATEYRAGKIAHVTGLVASGDQLTIRLVAPAPDILERLAMPFLCPVPERTPALRSGINPDPPISGAGPYYLAKTIRRRLVVLEKNPNYHGPRPQPFDAIAIEGNTAAGSAIAKVQSGKRDAAMLDGGERISGAASTIAAEWGPESKNAAAGDQRWFGGPGLGVDYIALNPSRPAFRDSDVRRAVSLALDRVAIGNIWVSAPTTDLLVPSVPGSTGPGVPVPPPDLEAARLLMKGRIFKVTMQGFPTEWQCAACRDFESAVTGQLKAIGITVLVRHPGDYPGDALKPGSAVDLLNLGSGADYPDPVALIGGLGDDAWLGKANLRELARLRTLSGRARIDGAVAFAHRLVEEAWLVMPTGYPIYPFFVSERIGCGFVQPAIGTVDLLSLCIRGGAVTPSAAPATASPGSAAP
jgi:ABC-type transport system substrate-binding protein/class 3 adenylate cyclase/streptogramin lyase